MVSTNMLYTFVVFLIVGIFVYYNSNWFSVKLFDSQIDNNIIRLSYFCGCLNYFIAFITLLLTAQSRSKEYAIVTITRAIINNILCFYFIIGYSLTFMAKIYAVIITQSILVLILLFLIRDMIGFKFSLSKLKKLKHLNCHYCSSAKIEKTLMAPSIVNLKKQNISILKNKKIGEFLNIDGIGETQIYSLKKMDIQEL